MSQELLLIAPSSSIQLRATRAKTNNTHVPGRPPIFGRKALHVEGACVCMIGRNPIFVENVSFQSSVIFSFIFLQHNHWFALLLRELFLWELCNGFIQGWWFLVLSSFQFKPICSSICFSFTWSFSLRILQKHRCKVELKLNLSRSCKITASGQIGLWSHEVGWWLHQSNFFQKLIHPSTNFHPITLFLEEFNR